MLRLQSAFLKVTTKGACLVTALFMSQLPCLALESLEFLFPPGQKELKCIEPPAGSPGGLVVACVGSYPNIFLVSVGRFATPNAAMESFVTPTESKEWSPIKGLGDVGHGKISLTRAIGAKPTDPLLPANYEVRFVRGCFGFGAGSGFGLVPVIKDGRPATEAELSEPMIKFAQQVDKNILDYFDRKITSLETALDKNFKNWATQDKITQSDIYRIIQDPGVQGDDLTALLFLWNLVVNKPNVLDTLHGPVASGQQVTVDDVHALVSGMRTPDELTKNIQLSQVAAKVLLDYEYQCGLCGTTTDVERASATLKTSLEDEAKKLTPDLVGQGAANDCFFMAPLAALVLTDPEKAKKMVVRLPNGDYQVTFGEGPDKEVLTVRPPTAAEIALYARGGIWSSVVESAYGEYRKTHDVRHQPLSAAERQRLNNLPAAEAISPDPKDPGGYPDRSLQLLTGKPYSSKAVRTGDESVLATILADAQKRKLPLTTNTNKGPGSLTIVDEKTPLGLSANHDFLVAGYDASDNSVMVRDARGVPSGVDTKNLPAGVTLVGQNLKMPLKTFLENFSVLNHPQ